MTGSLGTQELAHILAALRYCQTNEIDLSAMPQLEEDGLEPLNDAAINNLCEWLSTEA